MHYYALVEIAEDAEDIDAAVAEVMGPHQEREDESEDLTGIWDWYSIGGRWTGKLDGYEPMKDRRNMEVCFICHGSGLRDDAVGAAYRAQFPEYGCNGCDSTGIQIKHASSWVKHDGDISYRGLLDDDHMPFTLVLSAGLFSKEHWNGADFEDISGALKDAWASLAPGTRLVVVDYHC